jgi:ATP-dependent RNA helicase RhlE
MFDMGFLPAVRRIIALLPKNRQTMLFAATFGPELNRLVESTLHNPTRCAVGITAPAETVAHAMYPVPAPLKTALLTALLRDVKAESVLIFTRTKHRADRVAAALERAGHRPGVLHSNRSQQQRQRTLDGFRSGETAVLVATDIAARGIDVTRVSHVINYDVPDTADTYIHRIGRTGRATRSGEAFTLITTEDYDTVRMIEKALGTQISREVLPGFNYQQAAAAGDVLPLPRKGGFGGGRGGGEHRGLAYLASAAYRERVASVSRG